MKRSKVIIDTNIWVSFLITKDYQFLDSFVESHKITLIFSEELIEEFLQVTQRSKFTKFFNEKDVSQLIEQFDSIGKLIHVNSVVNVCRDQKDNFLLGLALDSQANYLVTGDNDLLSLQKIGKTKIVTVKKLENLLK